MIKNNSDSRTALYKVRYELEGEVLETDLILEVKRHNKKLIKRMISTLTNQRYDKVSRIKLHFRKDVEGFTTDVKLQREKEARIALGQRRRICSRFYLKNNPYQPKVYTAFICDDLQEHIKSIHQDQKLQYRFDLQVANSSQYSNRRIKKLLSIAKYIILLLRRITNN
jgi:hypothetical protein